jgi:hypothetical protein
VTISLTRRLASRTSSTTVAGFAPFRRNRPSLDQPESGLTAGLAVDELEEVHCGISAMNLQWVGNRRKSGPGTRSPRRSKSR